MVPVERDIRKRVLDLAHELSDDVTQREGWESRLNLAVSAMRGLALTQSFEPRARPGRDPWPAMRDELQRLLAPD